MIPTKSKPTADQIKNAVASGCAFSCASCRGGGQDNDGEAYINEPCPACGGTGVQIQLWCPNCDFRTTHAINGRVAECSDCCNPHEINPTTFQPL